MTKDSLEHELLELGQAMIDGSIRASEIERAGQLIVQFHAPRHSKTIPTQDGHAVHTNAIDRNRMPPKRSPKPRGKQVAT
jgi:hypothetical protein